MKNKTESHRTIIAGSRDGTTYENVERAIQLCPWQISTIVSGGARGTDKYGEEYGRKHNIPIEIYPTEWDVHGRGAGYIRNKLMASKANALIAIWNGRSKGTEHMIKIAKEKGLKTYVYQLSENQNHTEETKWKQQYK